MFSKLKNIKDVMRVCRALRRNGGIRICSEDQAQDFAGFVGYRAQLALYELHTDLGVDMPWDDFVLLVLKSAAIREKIQRIVRYAITHFKKSGGNSRLLVSEMKALLCSGNDNLYV